MEFLPCRMSRGALTASIVMLGLMLMLTYSLWISHRLGSRGHVVNYDPSIQFVMSAHIVRHKYTNQSDDSLLHAIPDSLPLSNQIPADVHYLWCGQRWFEFRHYLSVRSVLRVVRPDKVEIHCQFEPEIDKVFYHQWLDQLKQEYPWLIVSQMDSDLARFCTSQDRNVRIELMAHLLSRDGGMYVSENTLILDLPSVADRSLDMVYALDQDSTDGYLLLRKNFVNSDRSYIQALNSAKKDTRQKRRVCCRVSHIYRSLETISQSSCMIVTGARFTQFYPMDVWEDTMDPFAKIVRGIFYGTEEVLRPVPSYDELVPNIGHMIWLNGGEMKYLFYLSVISMLYVANVDTVYIHGNLEPTGRYWQEIKTMKQTMDRVKFIIRTPPFQIFQGEIDPTYWALMSDVIRCDLMIRYGGIYTDTDALWVKPLSYEDRGYDAVASYDWVDWGWPFPDTVNFGISYGKRNAPFWRIFKESMRTLHNDVHGFTGVLNPYKILEKYPQLLRVDRHLQVICYHSKCHPTWVDDYHNMTKDHTNMNSIPNWRQDVNAFHWTHPDPVELTSQTEMLRATGIFAEMGRNVLQRAGLL